MDASQTQAQSPLQADLAAAQINDLVAQVTQQQVLLQQLLQSQGAPSPHMSLASDLHDLPTRPRIDWQPSPQLAELSPTLEQNIFDSPLPDEDRGTPRGVTTKMRHQAKVVLPSPFNAYFYSFHIVIVFAYQFPLLYYTKTPSTSKSYPYA
ncbi:hypothetical protein BCR43DRAFT_518773 [Syncephalastrum racemosum]|uniref:Uncharacterized protein n=1 Tax=Syncephalastrum racemosum TaxID=13706 RepID=A0A1X2H1Z6_SYNRA|nr:hypothetical protein BCR43DRAFT_518773 [Syncephalastrum racemosum]